LGKEKCYILEEKRVGYGKADGAELQTPAAISRKRGIRWLRCAWAQLLITLWLQHKTQRVEKREKLTEQLRRREIERNTFTDKDTSCFQLLCTCYHGRSGTRTIQISVKSSEI